MAENQSDTAAEALPSAVQEQHPEEQPYNIRIEDAGPATKKVWVEVPKEKVAEVIAKQFKELRQDALIPGFRKGHAPQKLIEKKFATDVKEQVRRTLISDSYEQAVEKNSLKVIGEPEFDNPDKIELKQDEPLTYSFSVEIQPDITLPELKAIPIKRPKITVTEEHIDQAMKNLREQQGTLLPVEDRGVAERDYIIADVVAILNGLIVSRQDDAQIVVTAGRVAGVHVEDLPRQLEGAKPGEKRTLKVKLPDTYPNESMRGAEIDVEITVKDIKRLEPAELNQEFLDGLGFTNEQELRQALREQMDDRIVNDIKAAMRGQVIEYLLKNVEVTLPARLTAKQTERVVGRRAVSLMMRGVSREQIAANIERLKTGAFEEGVQELKSFFILQKVAEQMDVDVSEAELNGRIANIALQQGRRPEKLRAELMKDTNTLTNLYVQVREEKAIDRVLDSAQIEEVEPTAEQQKAVSQPPSAGGEQPAAEAAPPAAEAPAPEAPATGGESSAT
jgi:trigger factor